MAAMRPRRTSDQPQLTRRQWTALLSAAPLAAQTVQAPPTPSPAAPNLEKALDGVRQVSARLAKLEVPMNVEPAFSFKV